MQVNRTGERETSFFFAKKFPFFGAADYPKPHSSYGNKDRNYLVHDHNYLSHTILYRDVMLTDIRIGVEEWHDKIAT